MVAGNYRFVCEQGTTLVRNFFYRDDDDVAIDISNYTAIMTIAKSNNATPLDTYTSGVEITITGPTGQVNVTVANTVTENYDPADYVYNLDITSPAGVETRFLSGTFSVVEEVK